MRAVVVGAGLIASVCVIAVCSKASSVFASIADHGNLFSHQAQTTIEPAPFSKDRPHILSAVERRQLVASFTPPPPGAALRDEMASYVFVPIPQPSARQVKLDKALSLANVGMSAGDNPPAASLDGANLPRIVAALKGDRIPEPALPITATAMVDPSPGLQGRLAGSPFMAILADRNVVDPADSVDGDDDSDDALTTLPSERLPSVPLPGARPRLLAEKAPDEKKVGPLRQRDTSQMLAFARPDDSIMRARPQTLLPGRDALSGMGERTAVYDIEAHTVYMPNGERLEAHSGLGMMRDNPRFTHVRNRGSTPPHTYKLTMRESLFHNVEAIRLTPVDGKNRFGRDGLLAHTYMLGKTGSSNGCVVFKDYRRFLNAFKRGEVTRLVVLPNLSKSPVRVASNS